MAEFLPSGQIKNLIETFKDAIWPIRYVGYFLAALLLFQYGLKYFTASQNLSQEIDRLAILITLAILVIGGIVREIQIRRDRRFADAQKEIHEVMHGLRDLSSYLDHVSEINTDNPSGYYALADAERLAKLKLTSVLDSIRSAFSQVSGVPTRVAIKGIMEHANEKLVVFAIARDHDSQQQNHMEDRRRQESGADPIDENEDFEIIFYRKDMQRWFFDNFLPERHNYKNSRSGEIFKRSSAPRKGFWRTRFPRSGWELPYVAPIVWPIQQREAIDLRLNEEGCIAFLAIDANRKEVFDDRTDVYMGAAFADALFHPLKKLAMLSDAVERAESHGDAKQVG